MSQLSRWGGRAPPRLSQFGADDLTDTGDRPYKCQFCGDQFARSDLLARHVNKCHANEKPLLPPGPRRKGSVSTSRATTSKQACDQCVQHCLPCDGANPCGKCNQRKTHCTFVKFHRQTAPVGPGHDHPQPDLLPPLTPSASVPLPPLTVPSMADNLFSDSFIFPPLYSDNTLVTPLSSGEPSDFTSRYRARADFLRRSNQQVGTSSPSTHSWGGVPWDHAHSSQEKINRHQQPRPYLPNNISMPYRHSIKRPKYDFEVDLDLSDGSASSIPSSTGSEIHLPLSPASAQVGAFTSSDTTLSHSTLVHPVPPQFPPQTPFQSSSSIPSATNMLSSTSSASRTRKDLIDESAFGALSIDDSTLLSTNAPSFFSDVASIGSSAHNAAIFDPNDTPMPPRPASSTEGDDLWRTFMRSTPVNEQPHHQLPSRRASLPAFNFGYTGSAYHSSVVQDKRSSSSQLPFHEPRYALQTQQSDDLSRYRQAVLTRARETETVLRPPPSKPRQSTVDTGHGPDPGQGQFLAISPSVRRRVSRSGSADSSGSSTSGSSLVGATRDGARERMQEAARPRMKRELSNAMREEPESKRRVVGGSCGDGRG